MAYNQNQLFFSHLLWFLTESYSKVDSLAKGPVVLIGYSAETTPLQLHDDRMMKAITWFCLFAHCESSLVGTETVGVMCKQAFAGLTMLLKDILQIF